MNTRIRNPMDKKEWTFENLVTMASWGDHPKVKHLVLFVASNLGGKLASCRGNASSNHVDHRVPSDQKIGFLLISSWQK